jgi:hypothetical protein
MAVKPEDKIRKLHKREKKIADEEWNLTSADPLSSELGEEEHHRMPETLPGAAWPRSNSGLGTSGAGTSVAAVGAGGSSALDSRRPSPLG